MSKKNYYDILGIQKDAKDDEIKKAFRKLALKYHPDRNHGDQASEQKFKEINEAYEILKNKQKRDAYDNYGNAAFQQGNGFNAQGSSFEDISDIFGDIFSDFMGGDKESDKSQYERKNKLRGSDLQYNTKIKLEDAFTGLNKVIKFKTACRCTKCNGMGTNVKNGIITCSTCKGSCKTRFQQGFFMIEKTCVSCSGMGFIIKEPCKNCRGEGRCEKEKRISIHIPKGVDNGTKIKINGQGESGIRGAEAGNLYIYVTVEKHEFYQRDNLNLHCSVPIKMTTSILGGSIAIPTIDGNVAKINIPPGASHGTKLRVYKKGMPKLNSSRYGDIYVSINVELPVKISSRQKKLLEEFEKINESGTNPETEGFFSKVKNFMSDLKK